MAERPKYKRIQFYLGGTPEEIDAVDCIVGGVMYAYSMPNNGALAFIFRLGLNAAVERMEELTDKERESPKLEGGDEHSDTQGGD
jgi:hypothetical protein